MIMRPQSAPHSFMTRFTQASSKSKPLSKQPAMKDQIEKKGRSEHEKRQKHDASGIGPYISSASDEKDRKSTRLNSSHLVISYAVFCLKKKNKNRNNQHTSIKHRAVDPQLEHRTGCAVLILWTQNICHHTAHARTTECASCSPIRTVYP